MADGAHREVTGSGDGCVRFMAYGDHREVTGSGDGCA